MGKKRAYIKKGRDYNEFRTSDGMRKAKPLGYRFVGDVYRKPTAAEIAEFHAGKRDDIYYESRIERSDKKPSAKKGEKFGKGGGMSNVDNDIMHVYSQSLKERNRLLSSLIIPFKEAHGNVKIDIEDAFQETGNDNLKFKSVGYGGVDFMGNLNGKVPTQGLYYKDESIKKSIETLIRALSQNQEDTTEAIKSIIEDKGNPKQQLSVLYHRVKNNNKFKEGGLFGLKTPPTHGNYLTLTPSKNGIKIELTEEGKEEAKEIGLNESNFYDLFEDIRGNSEYLYFEDAGEAELGLTSAPAITDGYYYNDDGDLTDEDNKSDSRLFAFMDYQVKSFVEELLENGEVIFPSVGEDKMKKGGDLNSLKGKKLLIYTLGVSDPITRTIESARVTPDNFVHRFVMLSLNSGSIEKFKLEELDNFLNGDDVEVRDSKGEPYVIALAESLMKKGGSLGNGIEKDTVLLPDVVAEGYAEQATVHMLKSQLDNYSNLSDSDKKALDKKYKEKVKEVADYLVDRAEITYANNDTFHKQLKAKGNKGRDTLHMFMSHWAGITDGKIKTSIDIIMKKWYDNKKMASGGFFHKAKEFAHKGYHSSQEHVSKKIHDLKKKTAIEVIDETKDKVSSNKYKMALKGAEEIVGQNYKKGGSVSEYKVDIEELPSPTKERVKNGAAVILNKVNGVPIGAEGIINAGYYKGLKGKLLYGIKDSDRYSYTVEILEGDDSGVTMDYVYGDTAPLIKFKEFKNGGEIEDEKLYYVVGKKKGQLVDVCELPMIKKDAERWIKEQGVEKHYDYNTVDIIPYHGSKPRHKYGKGGGLDKFKTGDSVSLAYISDNSKHNGKVGVITWLNDYNYYPKGDESVVVKKTQAEITYDDGSVEEISDIYQEGSGLVSPVVKVSKMATGGVAGNNETYYGVVDANNKLVFESTDESTAKQVSWNYEGSIMKKYKGSSLGKPNKDYKYFVYNNSAKKIVSGWEERSDANDDRKERVESHAPYSTNLFKVYSASYVKSTLKLDPFDYGNWSNYKEGGDVSGFNLVYETWDKEYSGGDGISGTIRTSPENYWVATILKDGSIKFDSWESMVKNIDQSKVKKLWESGAIKKLKFDEGESVKIIGKDKSDENFYHWIGKELIITEKVGNHLYRTKVKETGEALPYLLKFDEIQQYNFGKHMEQGGTMKEGKNGYVAFYKGKQMDVYADSSYQAQQKAAAAFKAKKSYEVTVVLAEKEGEQVTHTPDFKNGGTLQKGSPEWHQVQIAKKTVKMNPAMISMMRGMTLSEAEAILKKHGIKYEQGGNLEIIETDDFQTVTIKSAMQIANKAHALGIVASDLTYEQFADTIFEKTQISPAKIYLQLAYRMLKDKGYKQGGEVNEKFDVLYYAVHDGAGKSWDEHEQKEFKNVTWKQAVAKAKTIAKDRKSEVRLSKSRGYNNQGYYFHHQSLKDGGEIVSGNKIKKWFETHSRISSHEFEIITGQKLTRDIQKIGDVELERCWLSSSDWEMK